MTLTQKFSWRTLRLWPGKLNLRILDDCWWCSCYIRPLLVLLDSLCLWWILPYFAIAIRSSRTIELATTWLLADLQRYDRHSNQTYQPRQPFVPQYRVFLHRQSALQTISHVLSSIHCHQTASHCFPPTTFVEAGTRSVRFSSGTTLTGSMVFATGKSRFFRQSQK